MHPFSNFRDQLLALGYEKLPPSHPAAHRDATRQYTTYRKDGVRVAFGANRSLSIHHGMVMEMDDDDTAITLHAIITDPAVRRCGLATAAMHDITAVADSCGVELYIEPSPLEKHDAMDEEALREFYGRFGFSPTDDWGKVLERTVSPEPENTPS